MSLLKQHLSSPQALFSALAGLCVLLFSLVLSPVGWLENQLFYARLPHHSAGPDYSVLAMQLDEGEEVSFGKFIQNLKPNTLKALGICNPELLQPDFRQQLNQFKAQHQTPLVVASNFYAPLPNIKMPTLHRAKVGSFDSGYIAPVSIHTDIYSVQKSLFYRRTATSPVEITPSFSSRILSYFEPQRSQRTLFLPAPNGFSPPMSLRQLKRVPLQELQQSVLLVGSPFATDKRPVISALQTEAHTLRALLKQEAYTRFEMLNVFLCLTLIALSIVVFAFTLNLGLWVACGSVGTLLLSYITINILFFRLGYIWLDLAAPLLCGIAALGTSIYYFQRTEGKTRQQLLSTYRRHLPDKIVKELMDAPADALGQNERRVVTVMFTDIEGFSRMGEELPSDQIINILNEYLCAMTEIIFANNGSLDKYIGDGIMAVYGNIGANDPAAYAYYAVKTALEMQEKMTELQKKWMKEGIRPIQIRIGINTGDALVGNVGHPKRKELTVIGDTVNTAARIERLNKQYNTHILISQGTYQYVKNKMDIEPLGEEQLQGKTCSVNVYHVKGWLKDNVS